MEAPRAESDIISGFRARHYGRLISLAGVGGVYRKALTVISASPPTRALDVGCGTGAFLSLLRERYPHAALTGIDASEDMLAEARRRTCSPDGSIEFFRANAASLPFQTGRFDCAVSILAFHHMPPEVKHRTIGEISRILRKGGRFVIFDLARPSSRGFLPNAALWWFNRHSHTRGNWDFILNSLKENGYSITEEGTFRGIIGFINAVRPS